MDFLRGLPGPERARRAADGSLRTGTALTVGNFDGVHLGHQAMLRRLAETARARGLVPTVLTFEPHPRDFFARRAGQPERAPTRITALRDELDVLAHCGIERTVLLRFDATLATLSAADFIQQVLIDGLQVRHLLVGDDFRFGAERAGSVETLRAAAAQGGYDLAHQDTIAIDGERVSSTRLRAALAEGDLAAAMRLMGRPWGLTGRAIHGRKLGRTLGFRTLNQKFADARPALSGIFVAQVHGLLSPPPEPDVVGGALPAVASFGVRPSVEARGSVLLETHVLGWPDEIPIDAGYGRCLRVELLHKLHDERKYPDLEALQAGIRQDVADARAWFQARPEWPAPAGQRFAGLMQRVRQGPA